MKISFAWTPERDQQVREMAAQLMSARQIANAIGAPSRNSVISRASRTGVTLLWRSQFAKIQRDKVLKPKMSGQAAGGIIAKIRRSPTPPRDPRALSVKAPVATPQSLNVSLNDLPSNGCKFATSPDDAPSHLFCGAVKREGSPYCSHHHRIAYQPPKPRKVAA